MKYLICNIAAAFMILFLGFPASKALADDLDRPEAIRPGNMTVAQARDHITTTPKRTYPGPAVKDPSPEGGSEQRPGEKPGGKPGHRPDWKPGDKPGHRPDGKPGGKPGHRPDWKPGDKPGYRPHDWRPGGRPGRPYYGYNSWYYDYNCPPYCVGGNTEEDEEEDRGFAPPYPTEPDNFFSPGTFERYSPPGDGYREESSEKPGGGSRGDKPDSFDMKRYEMMMRTW